MTETAILTWKNIHFTYLFGMSRNKLKMDNSDSKFMDKKTSIHSLMYSFLPCFLCIRRLSGTYVLWKFILREGIYAWFILLYIRNWHNIVKQLYANKN